MMRTRHSSQQGVVAVYITLILILLITSATVVLGALIARQIRSSLSIVTTEYAFYAADGALEQALYLNVKNDVEPAEVSGTVEYGDGMTADYEGEVHRDDGALLCGQALGTSSNVIRRVTHGHESCTFD